MPEFLASHFDVLVYGLIAAIWIFYLVTGRTPKRGASGVDSGWNDGDGCGDGGD